MNTQVHEGSTGYDNLFFIYLPTSCLCLCLCLLPLPLALPLGPHLTPPFCVDVSQIVSYVASSSETSGSDSCSAGMVFLRPVQFSVHCSVGVVVDLIWGLCQEG